ncbi:hypothetical protein L218DRAFT_1082439 [Marasmius fiardii PR-910]|nr:hypothetical protein L218DRAFT_1082439 [Marasmius fiardii PR-910]
MPLPAGSYTIRSKVGNYPVGRSLQKDHSLNPKIILSHPEGTPISNIQLNWGIREKRPNSQEWIMISMARDQYASKINDQVFAILTPDIPPIELWYIEEVPQHGPNLYIIHSKDRQTAWTVDPEGLENPNVAEPILLAPVSTTPGPAGPLYPPEAVFEIVPRSV